jgi:hypothetical protein
MSSFCNNIPVRGKLSITEHRRVLKRTSRFFRFCKPGTSFWGLYKAYRNMALVLARLQLKSWRPNYRTRTIERTYAV